jgi:hypothetical protein
MCESSCSTDQTHRKSSSLGLRLLSAVGIAAALGVAGYFQMQPTHDRAVASATETQLQVAATGMASSDVLIQPDVVIEQSVQKLSSITGLAPAHTRATVVVVGTGIVAMSPLGSGVIPPAIVYAAATALIPDVVKFVSL